jgi:NAD(P)-dependent dehydrogenase (short-subunit alcohol dehydrogenase family)
MTPEGNVAGTLSGQVAIVTGGGRGIGKAIAGALAAEGASVAVTARSRGEIAATVDAIAASGGQAFAICADVRDDGQVRESVEQVNHRFGPVTLLVNNAGAPGPAGNDWEVDADAWWDCIEGIVRGSFLYNKAVIPGMIAGGGGRIVHIASVSGTRAMPSITATSVAKTALIRLAEGVAVAAGPKGVKAFAVHPGVVKTQLLRSYNLSLPENIFSEVG